MKSEFRKCRPLDLVVISDIHLGTYGCHAEELVRYLASIDPEVLVLNGDIVDMWQFSKRYWPHSHMKVLEIFLKKLSQGTRIYYLTGNHDDTLRHFTPTGLGGLFIQDKLVLNIDGKKAWFFHGDVLDSVVLRAKWLARLGAWGYDLLILMNRLTNHLLALVGRPRMSLSKKVKAGVKRAMEHVCKFEETIAELAQRNGFDWVVCGHIHEPQIKHIGKLQNGAQVLYLNSGDWVENLTALEYVDQRWSIFRFEDMQWNSSEAPWISKSVVNGPDENATTQRGHAEHRPL